MSLFGKIICEAIGTFGLCFIGGAAAISAMANGGDSTSATIAIALAHGLILFVLMTATMKISGAHFNPAITIAMWFNKRVDSRSAGAYIATQFAASLAAGALLALMAQYGGTSEAWTNAARSEALGNPTFDTVGLAMPAVIGIEAVVTFLLVFAYWGTAVNPKSPHLGGLAVGLVFAANIFAAATITGASMNPARSFGPGFLTYIIDSSMIPGFWTMQIAYFAGPLVGAIFGGILYEKFLMPPEDSHSVI